MLIYMLSGEILRNSGQFYLGYRDMSEEISINFSLLSYAAIKTPPQKSHKSSYYTTTYDQDIHHQIDELKENLHNYYAIEKFKHQKQ